MERKSKYKQQIEQNQQEQQEQQDLQDQHDQVSTNKKKWQMAFSIGLAAGVIWGIVSFLAYYLQFTDVGLSIYAKPILNPDYLMKWQGHLIGLGFFVLFTLVASIIYVNLLVRFKSPWAGIIYGLFLWGLIFIVLNPMLNLTKPVKELGLNTNSVMISLYILIGLFIGYSLSAEFNNEDKNGEIQ